MKNYLILHGHFYQPPRENPWTGIVAHQSSAAPYHDWNARITRECYAANAFSRILDQNGRISDIVNNYEYLSFNFGPTLMGWLKSSAPNIYRRIIEADNESYSRNNGHGNAIAQSFNHTILPLDTPEDAKIQIQWGLNDFKAHFGRDSEGIWLPETAVNDTILDILIKNSVKFIILSPWQAEAIQTVNSDQWIKLNDQPAPSWRPYKIDRPGGSIAVFFYNNVLAQGISFEHYLQNSDSLYRKLLRMRNSNSDSHLINSATDGEIFGHHEPFGDMCLAALTRKVTQGDELEFTNYGRYLELYPPAYRVRLKSGEEDKGTSWSCFHGVSRWYKNCGCNTGGKPGWNQEWRTPLRQAFRILSDSLNKVFIKRISKLSSVPPEEVLKEYIAVLTGKTSRSEFCKKFLSGKQDSEKNRTEFLRLLESQKYRMFTFTSCGWFFSELSGLEPVQNMKYALRAIELSGKGKTLMDEILPVLEEAESNIPEEGNGRNIINSLKLPYPPGLDAAVSYLIRNILKSREKASEYGVYRLEKIETTGNNEETGKAHIELVDTTTGEKSCYTFHIRSSESESPRITFTVNGSNTLINLTDEITNLPEDLRSDFAELFLSAAEESCRAYNRKNMETILNALEYGNTLKIKAPETIIKTAELAITAALTTHFSDNRDFIPDEEFEQINELIRIAVKNGIPLYNSGISEKISNHLSSQLNKPQTQINDDCIDYIYKLFKIANEADLKPEVTISQNIIFGYAEIWRKRLTETDLLFTQEEILQLKHLVSLGQVLNIAMDDLKEVVERLEIISE